MTIARKYTWGEAFIPGTKRYLRDVRAKAAAGGEIDVQQVAFRLQWSLKHDLVIVPVAVRSLVWELCNEVITSSEHVSLGPYRERLAALVSHVNPLATEILDPRDFAMALPEEYAQYMRHARVRFEIPATGA